MPKKSQRIIKKSLDSSGTAGPTGKQQKQITGTFSSQARRDRMTPVGKKGFPGFLVCGGCGAVYFDKHWHTPSLGIGLDLSGAGKATCEECHVSTRPGGRPAAREAEGEVVLEGLAEETEAAEVLALVRNVGKRALKRDPLDRILRIAGGQGIFHVFTSENQLAVSIGKQVHSARKGGTLTITWSSADAPVLVRWSKGKE